MSLPLLLILSGIVIALLVSGPVGVACIAIGLVLLIFGAYRTGT